MQPCSLKVSTLVLFTNQDYMVYTYVAVPWSMAAIPHLHMSFPLWCNRYRNHKILRQWPRSRDRRHFTGWPRDCSLSSMAVPSRKSRWHPFRLFFSCCKTCLVWSSQTLSMVLPSNPVLISHCLHSSSTFLCTTRNLSVRASTPLTSAYALVGKPGQAGGGVRSPA